MTFEIVRGLHILAVIAWMAGMLFLPRLYAYDAEQADKAEPLRSGMRDLLRTWQHRLLKIMGREDLKEDPRFATPQLRFENVKDLDVELSAWSRQHTKIEIMETLQAAGVPSGAVLDTQELMDDEHLRKRGMFVTIDHPQRGPVTMPAWPVKMSGSHVPVRSAPTLGQHTQEVLSEWLGLGPEEFQRLREAAAC